MTPRLAPHTEELVRRALAVMDELDPLVAEDADSTSLEWWTRLEQIAGRLGDAARLVARSIIVHNEVVTDHPDGEILDERLRWP